VSIRIVPLRRLGGAAAALTAFAAMALFASPAQAAATDGYVRLAHLSPDTPAVDVYLKAQTGDSKEQKFPGVSYGVMSPYLRLPADTVGEYTVGITPGNAAEARQIVVRNSSGQPIYVSDPSTATTTVLANPSDLSISVAANPGIASVGAAMTYVITVTNHGPTDAPGVVAVNQLPNGIAKGAIVASSQGTAVLNGSLITASLGTIPNGKSATKSVLDGVSMMSKRGRGRGYDQLVEESFDSSQ